MEDDITDASDTDENVTPVSENDQMTYVSETSFSGESHQQGEDSEDDSDATNCIEVQHTVTFKCIGTTHDFMPRTHYAVSASCWLRVMLCQ